MRLRTQLALFFTVMTAIVLALGLLTVWGGVRIVDRFSQSLTRVERLSQVRSLQNLLARQRAGLDIHLHTRDPKEFARFMSLNGVVAKRFREMWLSGAEGDDILSSLPGRHEKIVRLLMSTSPAARTTAFTADALIPALEDFTSAVGQAEARLTAAVREEQSSLQRVVRRGARVMVLFVLCELSMGFIFVIGTFRSLHKALAFLQEGTKAFGEGRFEHRIPVSSKDELGDLARSFNRMADDIKRLEVKTLHMHRMSAVGQLAGGVAHEINNPLTGVLGQAQLLLEKLSADDPHRAHVEKIERAAVRCRRIVRSLLDFSRQKETHFAEYHLNEAIEATLDLCAPDLQNGRVQVVRELSPLVPPMTGNSAQLQQVFLNLISNAVHAMAKGGSLTIATALAAFPPPGDPEAEKVDGVEVTFSDTGSGIDPAHLPHVFEPFFTTKDIGKGTGLGLSVSLGIARNHGGDIIVESEGKGKGALFRVLLPLTPPTHLAPLAATPPDAPQARF